LFGGTVGKDTVEKITVDYRDMIYSTTPEEIAVGIHITACRTPGSCPVRNRGISRGATVRSKAARARVISSATLQRPKSIASQTPGPMTTGPLPGLFGYRA
jgi:hypothetical protein